MTNCPECGMPPGQCYGICPTQDPYHGDQAAESADHDFNARYDDVRERYASTAEDADLFFEDEHDRYESNDDGSVTLITPSGGEHTYDPDDLAPKPIGAIVWYEHPHFIVNTVFNELYPPNNIDHPF